jgi:Kef-type K+ transport system membrane component KefB/nucleotide-binding universal stress UspA family protein
MLLLLAGMETDLKLVRRIGRAAMSVSVTGIAIPFACGFALGQFLPEELLPSPERRFVASLMLGTALSISSVKIVAMVVRQMNFMRRNVGQVILASAVIDDTIGWIIIAITFSLVSHGTLDAWAVGEAVVGTGLFLAASFTVGRPLVFFLIRWTNDNFLSEVPVITMILLLMIGMALITHAIGVHTVLGAFVAGILVGESPILTREIDRQLRGLITALFMPVFFGVAGLTADLTVLADPYLLMMTIGLIGIASFGKFAGAFLGGEFGGLTARESLALASGMNARGSTEVIVATIGLSMGVLSQNMFTMIVTMAIITTMAMPPMLRWALARLPMREEERERLDREEFEAKGFVSNIERMLLAVDQSPNGRFASRLAGMIAGARGIPMTIVPVDQAEAAPELIEQAVQAGAEVTAAHAAASPTAKATRVNVISRAPEPVAEEAVAREARKGYDLLLVGIDRMVAPDGSFHEDVNRIGAGFAGPLAIMVARGHHVLRPMESEFKILVPVTGTAVSRRAVEIGIALARATHRPATALSVATAETGQSRPGLRITPRREDAILKDAIALAEGYEGLVRPAMRTDLPPAEAILREAHKRHFDLIVMGVNRRPGESLYFGTVAATVLQKSKASILFISN